MTIKFGFILMALLMVSVVFLFGCAQQSPQKNETALQVPVVNNSNTTITTNQTQGGQGNATEPVVSIETKKAELNIGFSSSASSPIGKGLDSFNVILGRIEVHGSNGWTVASDKTVTINLKTVSGNRQQISLAKTTLGIYDKIRMNVIRATSVYITTASIPGVVAGTRTTQLTIPASIVELPINLNMTNESETYSVTVAFDIEQVDPATVASFDASSASATVKTYSQCMPNCIAGCEKTNDVYKECIVSCALDKNRDCDMNAVTKCAVDCNCPNNVCNTGSQEQCKSDCLKTEKSGNSTCKMAINATCIDYCRTKPSFVSCTESCMGTC